MSVQTLHYLAPVKIGTTNLGGITATDDPLQNDIRDEPASGELTARIQALVSQKLTPSFTTQDIAAALAACGSVGVSLVTKPLKLYAQLGADDGRRASGTVHRMFTYQHGLLLPESLDCNHRGDCSLSYRGLVTYDGAHDPVVISENQALPTISGTTLWTLASVTLAGVPIPQLQNVRISFGIKAEGEGADSDIWDTKPSVSAIQPVISVTGSKSSALLALLGATGNTSIVFRERADGGTFSSHTLTLSGSGMANFTNLFKAATGKPGDVTLEARLKYDGVNNPIVVTQNW